MIELLLSHSIESFDSQIDHGNQRRIRLAKINERYFVVKGRMLICTAYSVCSAIASHETSPFLAFCPFSKPTQKLRFQPQLLGIGKLADALFKPQVR